MLLSIIIINYNTFALTADCIRSVRTFTRELDYEIILVDNASTEHDAADFLEMFPGIKLIKSPVNGGFAYGNNLGIEQAAGEFILLLNSDTVLEEDSLSRTIDFFKKQDGAGVVGCRMVFPDRKVQYSARRFRSIGWELLDLFRFIPYLMPYKLRAAKMLGKYFRHDEDMECDWVNGAFFLFRKKMIEQFPGKKLDDRFFMYGEDQFWCEQAKKLEYRNYFYSGTTIIHINSGSTDPGRQLSLRRKMMENEMEIMRLRKGNGIYYFFFVILFGFKEHARNFIKWIFYKASGKLLR